MKNKSIKTLILSIFLLVGCYSSLFAKTKLSEEEREILNRYNETNQISRKVNIIAHKKYQDDIRTGAIFGACKMHKLRDKIMSDFHKEIDSFVFNNIPVDAKYLDLEFMFNVLSNTKTFFHGYEHGFYENMQRTIKLKPKNYCKDLVSKLIEQNKERLK